MFLSEEVILIFEQATELININIDAALEKFNNGINRAGDLHEEDNNTGENKIKQFVV